jgi:alpha,alpha-trehalose phosphorylase
MLKREILVPPEHHFPPDEWRIIERKWSPAYARRTETAFSLANGYLGARGTFDESRPSFRPGVYVNGFHETWPIVHPEPAYGLARVGQTLVNVPDATVIELFVDDEPLFLPTARTRSYVRTLDMRNGILSRDLEWVTPSGKHIWVHSTRLVSLEHRHVLAVSFEVVLDSRAPVVIRSLVVDRTDGGREAGPAEERDDDPRLGTRLGRRVLEPHVRRSADRRVLLGYRTLGSRMSLGIAVDHVVEMEGPHHVDVSVEAEPAALVLAADAEPGAPIRLVKYASYQTSRSASPQDLLWRGERTLDRVVTGGFDALCRCQRDCLDRFWDRADIRLEDTVRHPVRIQQAVRWNVFQLAQATLRAEGAGIPAKGLTGGAYDGHYFWDTETWVLPFLAYTQPRIARNLLRFRHLMLPKARERARTLGQRGALFPWRTISGEEASAYFQAGTAQYHINADIAYAIRRYLDVRDDPQFLVDVGAEILAETARFWADLGFHGDDGRFHIHGVTGPDEYTAVVDDNAFTNLMARHNLRAAVSAFRWLASERRDAYAELCLDLEVGPAEIDAWEQAAERMFIPYDDAAGITPQDATFLTHERWDLDGTPPDHFPLLLHYHPLQLYRYQVLKQADVVMAMFLLGNEFTVEQKRRNFDYYDPLTTGDSSLSASIQSIVATEIGEQEAACRYFDFALLMDLADVAGNASDGVHIASAAGAWMALVFGFGGVRDFDGVLTIDPKLPTRFRSLAFSLRFQDRQLRVELGPHTERYLLDEGKPLQVVIRGRTHVLTPGEALIVNPSTSLDSGARV